MIEHPIRTTIATAVCRALQPLPEVLAGWEGGSVAFDALDAYSDIDLNFIVGDDASLDELYAAAERSLAEVSPVIASHWVPPGRYYKLSGLGDYLFVDLCFVRAGAPEHSLDVERHGRVKPLFDKNDWLRPRSVEADAVAIKRHNRHRELQVWFPISQSFVRKAVLRGRHTEAMAAYWGYTLKPLVELVRMRHCPIRWDFGMRYLERDLPPAVANRLQELVFVREITELENKVTEAEAWGLELLQSLNSTE